MSVSSKRRSLELPRLTPVFVHLTRKLSISVGGRGGEGGADGGHLLQEAHAVSSLCQMGPGRMGSFDGKGKVLLRDPSCL